ncbi:MAG: WD40 repeat domain-containing protein [Actinomycetota bacterium]|nr:WD40 repeat domain-containing protein [Actinomycetota bacterium]
MIARDRIPGRLAPATALVAAAALCLALVPAADAGERKEVIFAGSNWEGTVEVIRPQRKYSRITQINVIPDIDERMAEILTDPVRLGYFLAIRMLVGEGNDQYVDDMYTTHDGRLLIASRPSLADVVGINLRTREIVWRFVVDGQRSDHMAISPDGRHVAVSASTGNVVHILNVRTGQEVGRFASGDSPHENTYSENGKKIFHASIGMVYTPADNEAVPILDSTKGERYFQVVRASDNKILKRIDMGQKLAEAGYPNMSAAVRPMALSRNERKVYLQVSFFHGFVEYSLRRDKVLRVANLPNLVPDTPREEYLLDSAHHGIAMSGRGSKLCVAGTMSDYVAMVNRRTFRYRLLKLGLKPYWATTTSDGTRCLVSWSGTDTISVISYRTGREIKTIPVGNHPQRVRMGFVRRSWIRAQG